MFFFFLTSEKVSGVVPFLLRIWPFLLRIWPFLLSRGWPFSLGFGRSFSGVGPSSSIVGSSFSEFSFSRGLAIPSGGWAFLRLALSYRGLALPSVSLPFLVSGLALLLLTLVKVNTGIARDALTQNVARSQDHLSSSMWLTLCVCLQYTTSSALNVNSSDFSLTVTSGHPSGKLAGFVL